MLVKQIDSRWWHLLNRQLRNAQVRGWDGRGHLLVNEYPKSGGSWLAQMLSEIYALPFPRNRLPMLQRSMLHGHYIGKVYVDKHWITWRDGRDVMVSFYFHRIVGNELASKRLMTQTRSLLGITDAQDIDRFLPRFIEHCCTKSVSPDFSWPDFVNRWADCPAAIHVKYEELRTDAIGSLRKALGQASYGEIDEQNLTGIVEHYSFERQSGRKNGNENGASYLRKGIVGDWSNKFSREAREMFAHYCGDSLVRLGYERDNSWVKAP